ncbi:MAG TPA: CehA/McbA family metallohydrolase [Vicinamibacterales bacterium]|nr:CehA/McbA family metallohydrolase [Vicinamibacterales bacterium]
MKRLLGILVLTAAVLSLATVLLLPPRAIDAVAPDFQLAWPVARGAYHVHSQRSDGTGTLDEIAAAAAAAGLQFVIVTDHGDGTRDVVPPTYRAGVLCLDGVEISTDGGHYVALGLAKTPYRLAGHPRDVIEDVRRLGGFGFAAHPGSPKAALRWTDWEAPFDGIEWLNADSEWRDEFWGSLGKVLLTYAVRPSETLAGVLDRPVEVLQRWDHATRARRVPALAGADAHARLSFGPATDPYQDRVIARLPAYEVSFQAFSNHVVLNGPLTGDAANDAGLVLDAIREGRTFTSVDGLARLGAFEGKATSGEITGRPGEYLDIRGPVAVEARIAAPPGTTLAVLRDGIPLYETAASMLRLDVGEQAGAYRIEARLPAALARASVPWILTNPIYVGLRAAHEGSPTAGAMPSALASRSPIATRLWQAEASDGSRSRLSQGVLDDGTPAMEWQFALADASHDEQYAAIRFPVEPDFATQQGVQLRVRSDRPRRVWAQVRAPAANGGERWGMSFYVDQELRQLELRFADFRPIGPVTTATPSLSRVDSLLLVVDTVHSAQGVGGGLWIPDLWLVK